VEDLIENVGHRWANEDKDGDYDDRHQKENEPIFEIRHSFVVFET